MPRTSSISIWHRGSEKAQPWRRPVPRISSSISIWHSGSEKAQPWRRPVPRTSTALAAPRATHHQSQSSLTVIRKHTRVQPTCSRIFKTITLDACVRFIKTHYNPSRNHLSQSSPTVIRKHTTVQPTFSRTFNNRILETCFRFIKNT